MMTATTIVRVIIDEALAAYDDGAKFIEEQNDYVLMFHDDMWTHIRYKKYFNRLKKPGYHLERCTVYDHENKLIDMHWKCRIPKEAKSIDRLCQMNDIMCLALALNGKEE